MDGTGDSPDEEPHEIRKTPALKDAGAVLQDFSRREHTENPLNKN